jgi:nitrite reductase/ring-hydroxylating ferredoxin subunit
MAKHTVALIGEIPPGGRKIVEIAGRSIGVFNVNGDFFALRNRCPHQGAELCRGTICGFVASASPGEYTITRNGEVLRCPWHGWEFDIRSGQSCFDPSKVRVRRYEVSIEEIADYANEPPASPETTGAQGLQKGPYQAETYAVSIEQRTIVVDVPG